MLKRVILLTGLVCLLSIPLHAQNVGIGTNAPDTSALLHLESNNMGFLWPRMTTNDRNAIVNPATGLTIYNTQDSTIQYWNGVCWLNVYAESCNDCMFTFTSQNLTDTLDRTIADSVFTSVSVNQTSGTPQIIALTALNALPPGMTITFTNNPITPPGTSTVVVHADPSVPAGNYPIVLQAVCGNQTHNLIYTVYVEPCYLVNITNSIINYNLATDFYTQYPSAPTNSPVCILATIGPGVNITSNVTSQPAFTTGTLPNGSVVTLVNNGNIIGKGGDGGTAYSPSSGTTGAGFGGGHAINLTLPVNIINNFNIYGGGGGGSAMAFQVSWTPPPPANIVTLGIFLGGGGGGAAGNGLGGTAPGGVVGLSYYSPGTNGTPGQFGVGGNGGILNFPIPVTIGPVTMTLNPNAVGGNGGGYGYPGTQGYFNLTVSASVTINIPFVGPITIPVVNNVPIPTPVPPPAVGQPGFAIKRNGFATNIPDNLYNTNFLRGAVGP